MECFRNVTVLLHGLQTARTVVEYRQHARSRRSVACQRPQRDSDFLSGDARLSSPGDAAGRRPPSLGTRVVGTWGSCGSLDGVRLRALMTPACNAMDGVLRATRHVPLRFFATRSRCGDGIVDVAGGEQCDASQGCTPPATCTRDCRCKAPPRLPSATTTTTIAVPVAPATDQP